MKNIFKNIANKFQGKRTVKESAVSYGIIKEDTDGSKKVQFFKDYDMAVAFFENSFAYKTRLIKYTRSKMLIAER